MNYTLKIIVLANTFTEVLGNLTGNKWFPYQLDANTCEYFEMRPEYYYYEKYQFESFTAP